MERIEIVKREKKKMKKIERRSGGDMKGEIVKREGKDIKGEGGRRRNHYNESSYLIHMISILISLKDNSTICRTLCVLLVAITKSSGSSCCNINHIA